VKTAHLPEQWRPLTLQAAFVAVPTAAVGAGLLVVAPHVALAGAAGMAAGLIPAYRLGFLYWKWIVDNEGDDDTASDVADWCAVAFGAVTSVLACTLIAGGWTVEKYPLLAIALQIVTAICMLPVPRGIRVKLGELTPGILEVEEPEDGDDFRCDDAA
jgi:hypothetical protein